MRKLITAEQINFRKVKKGILASLFKFKEGVHQEVARLEESLNKKVTQDTFEQLQRQTHALRVCRETIEKVKRYDSKTYYKSITRKEIGVKRCGS